MRKTLAYLAAAGYLTMSATAAHATDGTIMFSGKLVAATCAITIQGPTANGITIQLPTIRASDLATPGVTAGGTPFAIALTECPPNQEVRVDFLNNTGYVDTSTGYVVDGGSGRNVELQLL
jgi:major type 1 subunit fimbrin (pilin)